MEFKRYGLIAGIVGLLIALTFLLFGGGIEVAIHNGIFWVGVILLLLGLMVNSNEVTSWSVIGRWLMVVSIIPLLVGYFTSTAAIWVGMISLITGTGLFWFLRKQVETKPARR